ncbi:DUF805 domain-containing protein [Streptococcus oricebi]|uniref:DUF805 domain-containing protein n=1 Tax=Streptococcus oricebi TaxID=1547447 RepID=A0ABS5B1E8_9STRE|nr:DUF805 domain-containing protein [Streptococcus oricebi]MBP2622662.1 hypothetical protein [Streptococcus oricebi]
MLNAYKQFWIRYIDFKGRSTRSDFWWTMLWHTIVMLPLILIAFFTLIASFGSVLGDFLDDGIIELSDFSEIMTFAPVAILVIVYYLAALIPQLALFVRRLRDANFHWAFIFVWAGPALLATLSDVALLEGLAFLGFVAILVLCSMPSKDPQAQAQTGPFNAQGYPQNPSQPNPFTGQGQPQNPGQANQFADQGYPQNPGQPNPFTGQGYPQNPGQANQFPGQGYPQNPGQPNPFAGQGQPQNPGQANQFAGQGQPQNPGQPNPFADQGYPQNPGQPNQFTGQGQPQNPGQANPFAGQGQVPNPGQPNPFTGQGQPQNPIQPNQFAGQGYPQNPSQPNQFPGQGYPQNPSQPDSFAGPVNSFEPQTPEATSFDSQAGQGTQSQGLVDRTPGQAPVAAPTAEPESPTQPEPVVEAAQESNFQAQEDLKADSKEAESDQ